MGCNYAHTVEVGAWMSYYITLFYIDAIAYPCHNPMLVLLISVSKRAPRNQISYWLILNCNESDKS